MMLKALVMQLVSRMVKVKKMHSCHFSDLKKEWYRIQADLFLHNRPVVTRLFIKIIRIKGFMVYQYI
jgi:hypothetical protein